MAVLLPGAADLDAYWRNLLAGTDAITDVPDGRWDADYYRPDSASGPAVADQVYCRRGGFVDGLADVEVTRFGIMPNSVSGTEPDQLIALNVAAAALADAGGEDRLPDRHRIGVVLGRGGYLTPAWSASTNGSAPPVNSCVRSASCCPTWTRANSTVSGRRSPSASGLTAPSRPSAWCPTSRPRASPTASTCAAPPTPWTPPARRRWSPSIRR